MKRLVLLLALLLSAQLHAAPFAAGNAAEGKKFFDQNHCNRCHVDMMGGDGSEIFTRPDHKVRSASQLVSQINFCSGNAGIRITHQDEQNLAAYLNQRYYKLP